MFAVRRSFTKQYGNFSQSFCNLFSCFSTVANNFKVTKIIMLAFVFHHITKYIVKNITIAIKIYVNNNNIMFEIHKIAVLFSNYNCKI